MANTPNTYDETEPKKKTTAPKKTGTSANTNTAKKTGTSGNKNTVKKTGASRNTNTSKRTGTSRNTNTSKKKYSSGKTNSSRDINISKKTNSSKRTKNLKKMKKSKKSKDFLLWLVPLIMVIFLALEAGGLYYMTTHYGSSSGNQVAGNEDETTEADGDSETTLAALRQEQDDDGTEDESKRAWDGEFGGIDMGDNTFTINWTSEFATSFEVQCYDTTSSSWETVNILDPGAEDTNTGTAVAGESSIAADGTCTYVTTRLEPCREYRYRVVAYDADTWAVSATLICDTQECALDATIWPVKDLTAYTTSSGSTVAGTVETLKAYLVTDEADGRFGVKVGNETWYINSDYCMINLPDYIGELCEYDITNSYSSIYTIHDYSIPSVTNMVITGYEDVSLGSDEYLVPLLYPAAKKLVVAANDAKSRGYHLKIYDSYRPHDATEFLYSTVSGILYDKVPETEYQQTYRQVMIGSSGYSLNSFLAKGRSMHNLGIAMDLTLVDDSTGQELTMQTALHDLSYYAATGYNTEAADLLRDIMVDAGFGTLVSEWWHFQDNEARDSLDLPTLSGGVSPLEED